MKSKFVAPVIGLVLICGGTAYAAKVTTIDIWDWQTERIDLLKPKVAQYEKLHPNIKFKLSVVGWDTYPSKALAAIIGGNPPDIIEFHNSWTGSLLKVLAPFPPELFPSSQMVDQYYQFNTAFRMKDGKFYFFPDGIMTSQIFYNKKYFSQAGIEPKIDTWDELRVTAKKLTKLDANGKMTTAGFSFPPGLLFDDLNYQLGGSIYNDKHTGVDWFTSQGQKAIGLIGDMTNTDRIRPGSKDGSLLFEADKVGMFYSWTHYKAILETAAVKKKVQWGAMPLPTFSGSPTAIKGRNNYESGYAVPANLKSTEKLEAFQFLKWLYNDDVYYTKLNDIYGRLPGKKALWNKPELVNDTLHNGLVAQVPYTIFPGERPSWIDEIMTTMETAIVTQKKSPIDALKDAQSAADKKWKVLPPKWIVEEKIVDKKAVK